MWGPNRCFSFHFAWWWSVNPLSLEGLYLLKYIRLSSKWTYAHFIRIFFFAWCGLKEVHGFIVQILIGTNKMLFGVILIRERSIEQILTHCCCLIFCLLGLTSNWVHSAYGAKQISLCCIFRRKITREHFNRSYVNFCYMTVLSTR